MDNTQFNEISIAFLEDWAEKIEAADSKFQLDVEYADGILNIEIEATGQQYVINKHEASKQIWLSSPFSGAGRFSLKSERWIDSKNRDLETVIISEFKDKLEIALS